MMQKFDLPMYTIREAELLAKAPKNIFYKYIRDGELNAVKDVNGQLRIPYEELVHFVLSRT